MRRRARLGCDDNGLQGVWVKIIVARVPRMPLMEASRLVLDSYTPSFSPDAKISESTGKVEELGCVTRT